VSIKVDKTTTEMTRRGIQAHSNNRERHYHVTKVLVVKRAARIAICLAGSLMLVFTAEAEDVAAKPAESLYLQLGQVGLSSERVYQVRGASLSRPGFQITLDDGTIAFTQDVMGRITGAFFEGDGEILLSPPSDVERRSMSFFTGMAILEERFATAFFRFNDDSFDELRPDLRAASDKQEFVDRWGNTVRNLAAGDAMRLLVTFSEMLPIVSSIGSISNTSTGQPLRSGDRFLHARLQGTKLGVFDVYFDSTTAEPVQAGQIRTTENGVAYYDVWTSFSPLRPLKEAASPGDIAELGNSGANDATIAIQRYTITADVQPPKQIHARANLKCQVLKSGARLILFELSRFLNVESVTLEGRQTEFIHNPALEGTHLSRQGNDLVAVVLPAPVTSGKEIDLDFVYGGEVLAEAGNGLLYVGARGTWYPNRGMEMANFDLQFSYPQGWTLVATGKPSQPASDRISQPGQPISRFISERPIPLAGFNLGKYREATSRVGEVTVETYATQGVEKDFPSRHVQIIQEQSPVEPAIVQPPQIIVPPNPSPAQNEVSVGDSAARAIQYFSGRLGPFPYSHLALTQMPGRDSQGWPGLVFLSSFAFLTDQEREELRFPRYRILLQHSIPAHEAAHQWWGDLISWRSYRDQWFSEGLANYCALMFLQDKNPSGFREIMETYRRGLLEANKDGILAKDEGPVTLGTRLLSSRLPEGYEAISYGRGTWLFHMLRTMFEDAESQTSHPRGRSADSPEGSFWRALRKVRDRYEGKAITTEQLLDVFAEELPPSLQYENKKSLAWFLNGWVNGTALPKLELKSVKFVPKTNTVVVTGTILQKDGPPDLVTSVPIYASIGGQPRLLGRIFADGEESSFRLSAPAGTHKVMIDPFETILTSPK
jgi:hypothetical protein